MSRRIKPIWRILLLSYAVLMTVSLAVRFFQPVEASLSEGQQFAELNHSEHDGSEARTVKVAYTDTDPAADRNIPTILLLHGSSMAVQTTFGNLIPQLSKTARIIAPDLPGFGSSTRRIPDYSAKAHALFTLSLLDRLSVENVHIVAYSMGGGVALNIANLAPHRVRSITMLSAIGVQEFELLGQYHLNHAIHGLQLATLWSIHNLVPEPRLRLIKRMFGCTKSSNPLRPKGLPGATINPCWRCARVIR